MCVAAIAVDFGAAHEPRLINAFADHIAFSGRVERRPTCARIKLRLSIEYGGVATHTSETYPPLFGKSSWLNARSVPLLAGNLEGQIAKLGAPVVVGFNHFFHSRTSLLSRTCPYTCDRAWPQM